MKTVALILARGGSKGIPNKNIIKIKQKPLLAYSILAAQKSNVDEVWVSTDCEKIKSVALDYKAKVLDRPTKYATDFSKSEDALIHFAKNINFNILVFIQPTSPLIKFKEHWLPRWSLDKTPDNWEIENRPMRQEIDEKYVENGAFYITSKEALMSSCLRYSGNIGIIEMPLSRSFQIDNEDDLLLIKELINE